MKLSEELRYWGHHAGEISDEAKKQHLQMADAANKLEAENESLREALAKKTKDFRAFREARIGHDYITHSEELEAENERLLWENKVLRANMSLSVLRRLIVQEAVSEKADSEGRR